MSPPFGTWHTRHFVGLLRAAALNRLTGFLDSLRERLRQNFNRLDAALAEMDSPDDDPAAHNPELVANAKK